MHGTLYRLGSGAARHRRWVVPLYIVLLIVAGYLGAAFGGHLNNDPSIPGTQAQEGIDVLESRFSDVTQTNVEIVVQTRSGTLDTPQNRDLIAKIVEKAKSLSNVTNVTDPFGIPAGGGLGLSKDGTTAVITVDYNGTPESLGLPAAQKVQDEMNALSTSDVQIAYTGSLVTNTAPAGADYSMGIGLIAAIIILALFFGTFVGMSLPLLTALIGLGVGINAVLILARVVAIPVPGPVVALMIGLGVGIDYSLFIVGRYREFLEETDDPIDAIGRSVATAGRAVLVAGATVIVALLGMLVVQIPIISAMAYAAAIVVAAVMLTALVFLPAVLGFVGHTINKTRVPGLGGRRKDRSVADSPFWARWSRHVTTHAWPYLVGGIVLLLILAYPILSMRLGPGTPDSEPASSTDRQAYDMINEGFGPGYNDQILVVVELPKNSSDKASLAKAIEATKNTTNVVEVSPPMINAAGDAALYTVTPGSGANDPQTRTLVLALRQNIPNALAGSGVTAYVSGFAAAYVDLDDRLGGRLVPFILTVVAIAFILLIVVFRSVLIPLTAAILNILSVSAAYGVLVAVFQWGWGLSLIGIDQTMPIVSFVPVVMFSILFGLSMDYEVFILTRIHEEWARTGDNTEAVVAGLSKTARLVTSAAAVMIIVFLAFVISNNAIVKMIGLGLGVAILVDATITRMILVPAAMRLAGRTNWWLPRWLDRALPDLHLGEATKT